MNKAVFESKLLPNGHLYCPEEFVNKKNALFKVIVTFEDTGIEHETELSAVNDISDDFLSKEELDYYFNLEEL